MSAPDPARGLVQRRLWLVPQAPQAETAWRPVGLLHGQARRALLAARDRERVWRFARVMAAAPVGVVVASDLRSDLRTARRIARAAGVRVVEEPRLRGRSLGPADGLPDRSVGTRLPGIRDGRVVDADAAPPGGESVRDLYRRVSRFAADLLGGQVGGEVGGDLVLVADRGTVAVLLAWLDGTGPAGMAWLPVHDDVVVGRSVPVAVPVLPRTPGDGATPAPFGVGVPAGLRVPA